MGLTYPSNKICPRCRTGGYVWYLDNSKYVAKCTNCGHYFQKEDFPMCVLDRTEKSTTNADHIRAMSDEELASKLYDVSWDSFALGITYTETEWLEWLKQEAEA